MQFGSQCKAVEEVLNFFLDDINKPADFVLRGYLKERSYIGSHDRQMLTSLFYGVLRNYFRLRFILKQDNIPPLPRWLILSYLIDTEDASPLDLEQKLKIPSKYGWEPLSERHMEILKTISKNFRKFKDRQQLPPEIKYGLPPRIIELFQKNIPIENLESLLEVLQEEAPTDIRVNPLKQDRETMLEILRSKNWEATPTSISPYGIRLKKRYPIISTEWFKKGLIEIQDEGAQILSFLSAPKSPKKVLDYCAGAGGKSILIGALMKNKGQLALTDVHKNRLKEASKRCKRAGLSNHVIKHLETDKTWVKRQKGTFDIVLVDTPCSGTGTWRRHVDAKLKFTQELLDEVVEKQTEILQKASAMVKPGGQLIYATCSILKKENEEQIELFLERNPSFILVPAKNNLEIDVPDTYLSSSYLKILPSSNGSDGFFAAILEKN